VSEVKPEQGCDDADLGQHEINDFDPAGEPIPSIPAHPQLIFLHSSWRTSSTWLWSKFRRFAETICFREPFNEDLLTITPDKAASADYKTWDSHHPPGDPYYLQYRSIIQSTGGVQSFDPSIPLDWFIPINGVRGMLRDTEIRYLSLLIDRAREEGKIPVFGETRSLGRLWAIRNLFGGLHIFVYRNLWRHWLSYLYYRRRGIFYFYQTTALLMAKSDDHFLAGVADFYVKRALQSRLGRDGKSDPPPADADRVGLLLSLPESHAFAMFMTLHIYLYLHALLSADLTVDVTTLGKDSGYRSRIENALARQTGLEISLSDVAGESRVSGVAIGAAAIDWDEIREHARAAVRTLSVFADPTDLMESATALIDSAIEEMHRSEAALAKRSDAAEEIWYGRLQEARCHWALGDNGGFVRQALSLFDERPDRGEPLFDLARFHRERGLHETAVHFAEAGLALERPEKDAAFVEDFVYETGLQEELSIAAFYCREPGRKDRGAAACNWLALNRNIPAAPRDRARSNLSFYAKSAAEIMPSFAARHIDFTPPEGWHATNPSVARFGNGIVMVLRAVNYALGEDGNYLTPNGTPITTRNFLLGLNAELDVEWSFEILPPSDLPAPVYGLALGFEDLRLFAWRGALWCTATLRELTPEGWCQQVLARIDESLKDECRLTNWQVLAPEGPRRHEKNWMPLVPPGPAEDGNERLRFFYLCDPTRLVDESGGTVAETTPAIAAEEFRGGTQAIAFAAGWLALVHEVVAGATYRDRAYHHRFVWFDAAGALRGVSRPFFLQKRGVEFAAGLAWHPDGKCLIISYGVGDGEAWVATVDMDDVACLLEDTRRLPFAKQQIMHRRSEVPGAVPSPEKMPLYLDLNAKGTNPPLHGTIVENAIDGKKVRFFVTNPHDAIMQYHIKGQFYEKEELDLIASYFKGGGVFVDIGANIGNHCVYISKLLPSSKILAFEPNQTAIAILRTNLLLNRCENVDTRFLGIALGSREGRVSGRTPDPNNLGHTVYAENLSGDVRVSDGDSLLLEEPIEFIKVDVEGMEIEILAGLRQTIRRWQPNLFIEVWDWKLLEFQKWCDEEGYSVVERFQRYSGIQNYVLMPRGQVASIWLQYG
jgi:FkbM family methyltransferase